ncbi:DNA cytosine methyltransferase [Aminobacter aganoensis]|uniref:DNA (Cytosine-5)-methyltransferase 1 n=1 Tax=Aminobacter aganoensis TaxID=83264 RepID=A0A7X0F5H6_9HYPH|nr:DNA cytosine methyltransferase [Aminobacter aganoensis]MBB6353508.1 DNA (cytosine-5)-methyltransferase 1 [Aminobacter aganoensis]
MTALYNEIDPAAAHILRRMIDDGVIAPGVVDTRSIKELTPDDLAKFTQVHLFAGGGLWSVAARLAGWPDWAPIWTASCPCQPFSAAGKGEGTDDPRHLWPDVHRLARAARPPVIMGEQVAGAAGYGWFDGVRADLARENYASRSVDFPACSVDAPHQRNRQYWSAINVVDAESFGWGEGWPEHEFRSWRPASAGADASGVTLGDAFGSGLEGQRGHGNGSRRPEQGRPVAEADGAGTAINVADSTGSGRLSTSFAGIRGEAQGEWPRHGELERLSGGDGISLHADANRGGRAGWKEGEVGSAFRRTASQRSLLRNGTYWSDADWIVCHDDKARRAQSGIRFLVDGLPGRVDLWRVGGNAIVPEAAAEVIAAFIDVYGLPSIRRATS